MMNNVISILDRLPSAKEHVEIWCAWVTDINPPGPRRFRYMLDWVEMDGSRTIVWDGHSHAAALEAAREWAPLPIIDKAEDFG